MTNATRAPYPPAPSVGPRAEARSHALTEQATLAASLNQVAALTGLRKGWNGYDALPPSAESVERARRWLQAQWEQCQTQDLPWHPPNVTADAEEHAVLEWWAADRTLTVYFDGESAEYLKFGRQGGPLAGLREHGVADTTAAGADLMRWFSE